VTASSRSLVLDGLKALASQIIVLHHLSLYAPALEEGPSFVAPIQNGLAAHGRLAVPIFLVIAGYLAAQSLAPHGALRATPLIALIARRWFRLTPSYWAALALCLACCSVARSWADLDALPDRPTLIQVLAHCLFLQDILNWPALSAGVWYVAIDLQLYGLLAALLAMARSIPHVLAGYALVITLTTLSLFVFNLMPEADCWGPYFFGPYGLGALAAWSRSSTRPHRGAMLIVALGVLALTVDWRPRIALATLTAVLLTLTPQARPIQCGPGTRLVRWLSDISYSVFLTHFAVAMLCFAAITRFGASWPLPLSLGLAWATSLIVGAAMHHWIETPRTSPGSMTGLFSWVGMRGALSSASGRKTTRVSTTMAAPPTRSL
jgi:peptidoglycan/LPS O-acetylase OafA/YrhL